MTRRPSICSGCFLLGFSPISPAFHSPIVIHWLPLPGNRSRFSPFFSADPTSLEIDFLAATFVWLSVFSYKEQLVVGFPPLLHFFFGEHCKCNQEQLWVEIFGPENCGKRIDCFLDKRMSHIKETRLFRSGGGNSR